MPEAEVLMARTGVGIRPPGIRFWHYLYPMLIAIAPNSVVCHDELIKKRRGH